ncbi:transporter substrate-binding domain-containing protein [Roseomonas sp. NAR14]|uniref:Transporter substrate-binding domain-containing protein n=1 Tax=Roseomonas acroporae TaxID=2937791 RepID=A0A9X1YDQ9_9PROT|nr:transporter substrate-binding domain-containing protein [Roseomonas acroporae]MCK8786842.1 transporter substrate-binding domain-containing protein [Roseomonas acroporae]
MAAGTAAGTTGGIAGAAAADLVSEYAPGAAGSRLPAILARGVVRVCIWPGEHAFSRRNPHNGELEGFDIDLAQLLAARLAVGVAFVEVTGGAPSAPLETDQCDVALAGIGVMMADPRRIDLSAPYMESPLVAVTRRGGGGPRRWSEIDSPGVVVVVARDTVPAEVMRRSLRQGSMLLLDDADECLAELMTGRADVLVSSLPQALHLERTEDWVQLFRAPPNLPRLRHGYAILPGDGAWKTELDRFVAAIQSDGSLARAARRNGLPVASPR